MIGAGAGNPPCIVDETADLVKAAEDIINGASFDYNPPCIAEKSLIVVESVAERLAANANLRRAAEPCRYRQPAPPACLKARRIKTGRQSPSAMLESTGRHRRSGESAASADSAG